MFIQTLTNTQGETVTDAILLILDANFDGNTSKALSTIAGKSTVAENGNNTLRYRVGYWKTQAAYDAGLAPFILGSVFDVAAQIAADPAIPNPVDQRTTEEQLWHVAANIDSTYLPLTAELMAEKHLIEVVLV